ncbi:MAG TPA: TonB-dependent receptor [Acidobacteriota bacterium]|nr:TonB-dependent receptor [Acidobacteriota bacterium]
MPVALAAQSAPSPSADEEVVQLEQFTVVTSLGKYAEEMTSAGTKLPLSVREVPRTVQVLNANFLKDTLAQNLDDVYGYVVGMTRVATGATDFNLRGFTSNGAGLNLHNIQIDGLPGLTTRFGSPNTANIERVEVLKGPASILYGLINPGGMLNLVTKVPQARRATTLTGTFSTYAGGTSSFGDQSSHTVTLDTTGAVDSGQRLLYRLIVRGEDRESFRRNNFYKNFYLYPSLTYRFSPATSLTVQAELIREKRLADYVGLVVPFGNLANLPAFDTNYNNPTDYERDQGEALSTTFRHDFSNGWTARLTSRMAVNENGRRHLDFNSLTSATPVQNSTYRRIYRHFLPGRNNVVYFYDANAYGELTLGTVKHTLLVGASYDYDIQATHRVAQGPNVAPINAYATPAPVAYPADGTGAQDTKTDYRNHSVYFSDHLSLGEHWRPSFGLRYEAQKGVSRNNTTGAVTRGEADSIVPSLGLLYLVNSQLSLYASYSESFIPNSLTAFDANDRNGFDPETARQVEIGGKAELLDGKLNATLSLYDIHKENVLVSTGLFTPAGNPISQLNGAERSKGVEFQVAWLPVPHWQVQGGLSYGDARITASTTPALVNSRILDSPRVTANFWSRYNVPAGALRGLGVGLGVTYGSSRPTSLTPIVLPSNTLVDTAVYYQVGRYHFAVNLANTLDRKYIASSSVNRRGLMPGAPRTVTFTVRANF